MADYPIQGKLRIRPDNYERELPFIRQHVGELSTPQLKSVPGYEFLKFWYVDFAATPEQWAALTPELDKRNILVMLYEAPLFYSEALAEEEAEPPQRRSRLAWLVNGLAVVLVVAALVLFALMAIDFGVCVGLSGVAVVVVIVGQVVSAKKTSRVSKTREV